MSGISIRRIVTGHDVDGKAIVREDDVLAFGPLLPGYEGVEIWGSDGMPVDNNERGDRGPAAGARKGARTLIRTGEMAPKGACPRIMHRTATLDYGVILSGRCQMHLDSGAVVELKAGDVVVQRGTNHAWWNPYPEPVRFLFVLIDAEPVQIGDQLLGDYLDEFPKDGPVGDDVMNLKPPSAR
jgi:quercetin dioxygenase-like cupin family protein